MDLQRWRGGGARIYKRCSAVGLPGSSIKAGLNLIQSPGQLFPLERPEEAYAACKDSLDKKPGIQVHYRH